MTKSVKRYPLLLSILLVNPDGSGLYPTIQDAMIAAQDGDEIHLAEGTFSGEGNRDVSFLGKEVTVKAAPDAFVIIETYDPGRSTHAAFILTNGEGSGARIQKLHFQGGYTEDTGLLNIREASPVISDCEFRGVEGTAVSIWDGEAIIERCEFSENWSNMYSPCIAAYGDFILRDSNLQNSHSDLEAGAAVLVNGRVLRCNITGNSTDIYGGSVVAAWTTFEDCTIEGFAKTYGGGVFAYAGCVFRRCSISGQAGLGAGIYVGYIHSSHPCVILENTTYSDLYVADGACARIVTAKPLDVDPDVLSLSPESWGAIKERYR